ncbi:hypothetical protein FRC14_007100 [Serendipita sp. 396]|nr:hypothetical protein FRC14_007100 [Serendipita sp. 396]KAG8777957.1 hypothetical protein FRC15_011025 [Serendipita sp. 397]
MLSRLLTVWLPLVTLCASQGVPTISTTSGKLTGTALTNATNGYLGIPFALPPVGQLRFAAPVAVNTPTQARSTTAFSPSCIQLHALFPSPSGESEDCLYLNVWTSPGTSPTVKKPVLVWFYGGGFNTGASGLPVNDLTKWAIAHPEIVFVSVNYRLNLFGYPNTPAITTPNTNAGIRDQRLAMEWVNKNIAAFGGDPSQVVFGGQSAGAASVGIHMYAYPSNPLARGAILMSGQAFLAGGTTEGLSAPGLPSATNQFPIIASAVGCPLQANNYAAQLDCLRQKSTADLTTAMAQQNVTGIGLVIDNQTVFPIAEYKRRGRLGLFAKVPILTGTTDNEGDLFAIDRTTNTLNETLSYAVTIAGFRCFDSWQSSYSIAAGQPTYRYRYLGQFPTISPPPLRAFHAADQLILFGTSQGRSPVAPPPTPLELQATAYLQKAYSAFVKDPTNGLRLIGWPRYAGYLGFTLVDIFRDNDVAEPVERENPTLFDAPCPLIGLGL